MRGEWEGCCGRVRAWWWDVAAPALCPSRPTHHRPLPLPPPSPHSGRQIKDIAWFFILSCGLLFFISAGLVSLALSAWQAVGWFGTWAPETDRPPWNRTVWDTSGCCSQSNQFFALMTAMFGYQARPTPVSLAGYFGYWAAVLVIIGVKLARGRLTDAAKGRATALPEGMSTAGLAADPAPAVLVGGVCTAPPQAKQSVELARTSPDDVENQRVAAGGGGQGPK